MKAIDLLIQLLTNIYELLKLHLGAPCNCLAADRENHVDHEERSMVQILKSIEKQVSISNDLAIDRHNTKTEVCQPCKPEVIKEVLRKQQVIDILKISDRTYYRHIENGILVPRQLGSRSFFYHSDLADALEYSRVHGYL